MSSFSITYLDNSLKKRIFMNFNNQKQNMSLNLLVIIKRSKANCLEKAPLYLRIAVNDNRSEISLKRFIEPSIWDSKRQQVKGRTEEAKVINEFIRTLKLSLYKHYNGLIAQGEEPTASKLKSSYFGKDDRKKTILEVFEYHNLKMEQQIGNGFSKSTLIRYTTTMSHVKSFLLWKYGQNDLALSNVNYEFITELEFYFRTIKNSCNNTAHKYISNFKKVVNLARKLGWINNDPFADFKAHYEAVNRDYLTEDEVMSLLHKQFPVERLNIVRDMFVFSCFTGLAYIDTEKLAPENIVIGIDGTKWINTNRTKTGTVSKVPLLPMAEAIISKYADNPYCKRSNRLLPSISNQKVNAYLKEIADLCGISKHLTYHVSRHTFATSITLANKVPIESVSKMLGHKSIKTTQIYSRVLDKKVSEDMSYLKAKYSEQAQAPIVSMSKAQ
jgi:site-specific recombinase XerD